MTVSYDDLKPGIFIIYLVIKHSKEIPEVSKLFLKNNLTESTKKYLDEAARQHYRK